ncbi:LamG-like jellyroll fold domain-containing protein [Flavobacterium reichenbachii]|uniref:Laminin G n=1 Tax=Flavobacterium reichenbachii TaxID=362418 RepID=A0A085ZFH7_9FLAO|nr:LamG-like jellyroll fold domain-containing protein [Flavobacterium reichenbachii]KFF03191.1 laminin G [Flavobacterium reichenbachii]OXB15169.1 T9SS C-terminal target domain-containing protein [Flavobacterium reichenbachii]
MRKIIAVLGMFVLGAGLYAQNTSGAKIVPVSQAIQKNGFNIQVGLPFLGQNKSGVRVTNPADIRFPWSTLYLYKTFAEESFSVSKGFYGDKVLITWDLRANQNLAKSIKIYRRVYTEAGNLPYNLVVGLSATETTYEDKYVEGGVLYEYKVEAQGVSSVPELYSTYITGIGYRNPTAVVTGNISYKGGNPVKDVVVTATPSGSDSSKGSGLSIPALGFVDIKDLSTTISNSATFQAWVKPNGAYASDSEAAIRLLNISSSKSADNLDITVKLNPVAKSIEVNIGGNKYVLKNYFPSGNLNSRGNDLLVPVSDFNKSFVHFSVVINDNQTPLLYVNGRQITQAYVTETDSKLKGVDATYKAPYFEAAIPAGTTKLSGVTWDNAKVGGGKSSYIDEIRIWKAALESAVIRTDYSRFISGNDARMVTYLRANEKAGSYAYDLSRNGFNYNENHGKLWDTSTAAANKVVWAPEADNYPTTSQLGVLGVTDSKGNYQISAIQYSGTGESYNITPMYGQHKFEANQQLVYLGQGSEVVNKIDFIDQSSFSFKGIVAFDTRGIFKSYGEIDGIKTENKNDVWIDGGANILDEGYNYYEVNGEKFPKGKYWKNGGKLESPSDDFLDRYAEINTVGANVYIDGNIVLDANNIPVVTDDKGYFDISVPIGKHYITIKKDGHQFVYNGRFPASTSEFKEFFEDSNEPVYFIDTTKVTVVGKVVGGSVEAEKPIGFGGEGAVIKSIVDSGITKNLEVSAKNNIGTAGFTLGYAPVGANVTHYTKYSYTTNDKSGEYRITVMPLKYNLEANDLVIKTNNSISLLKTGTTETFDFAQIPAVKTPEFKYKENNVDKTLTGKPYHYEKSFTYRSTPVLQVIEQTSDKTVDVGGTKISTENFAKPIYTQFMAYKIVMNRFERYTNNDSGSAVEVKVPVTDGELVKTNNLALPNSETITAEGNTLTYAFKGGVPSVTSPFEIKSSLKYRLNEVDYLVENFNDTGIILGGASDGSQTFVTEAPDVPAIILRDPPGSNSSATIEKGQSISFTSEASLAHQEGFTQNVNINSGIKFVISGGIVPTPETESEVVNGGDVGVGLNNTSSDGKTITSTYTFNKAISTSDAADYVGSDGDLYIGNSKNVFYGSFDNVEVSSTIPNGAYVNLGTALNPVYVSKQKALMFNNRTSPTTFMYSQKHILNVLIPEYELFITNNLNGPDSNSTENVNKRKQYAEKIRLWRKIILDNEKAKYAAKNTPEAYKAGLTTVINNFKSKINSVYNEVNDPVAKQKLTNQLNQSNEIKGLLDENFQKNISFDAGLGSYTQTVETSVIDTDSYSYNLVIDESLALKLGFQVNNVGIITTTNAFFQQDINSSLSKEETTTTNISYTIKDNDAANFLSVNVVDAFDGNGPIFITQGGKTSCPHETEDKTIFYNKASYSDTAEVIEELAENKRESLNFGTQKVEVPVLTVTDNDISNVSENKNAEFELKLTNNSAAGIDTNFLLVVDNTTNPSNAVINIEPNGTIVHVPYGKEVIYKLTLGKSISDIYDYKDIKIRLQSLCDGEDVSSEVFISASFVPSCSSVTVSAPLNNWVYNREKAFNTDGSTKPLAINLTGYNTKFKSFKKIDLEYKLATSPNWIRLHTYYGTPEFYDEAVKNNETQISSIGAAVSLTYNFDIASLKLSNGNYQIRARSTCTNNTEFISEIISGLVDLSAPQLFGTPLPTNGILSAGEDLKVSFNENIFYNPAVSTIEIKGQTNQLKIDHNVSLHFEGNGNTAVINNPKISSGNLSLEFWLNNETKASSASIISQDGGLNIGLNSGNISFTLGDITVQGGFKNDNLFHHYAFTYNSSNGDYRIFEDDTEIGSKSGKANAQLANNNVLVVGGNTFAGNLHDLRLWNKTVSREESYAKMYAKLIGNEANLAGYWPMNEGRDALAKDLARFKHATVNASWDIKPKGTSYDLNNGQYLVMDNVNFVQLTKEMDATMEFWIKTGTSQEATIFSNGKGDGTDVIQSNGLSNKWSVDMNTSGNLLLKSEGQSYALTTNALSDNAWHHVTLLFNRTGSLRTYVDTKLVSSNVMTAIGGFSGNKIWLGARGAKDLSGKETVDRTFTGKIDEFRLWNTLRNVEQINRDSYNEVDVESIGLLLYSRMNVPDPVTANGPRYYHADANQTVVVNNAVLSSGTVNYSNDAPAIKPERQLVKFVTTNVIKDGEMIIAPVITDWASLEGQILDITVHRMFDSANNMQESPVTWTAYVNRNEVSWFAEGYNEIVDLTKNSGETKTFEITLVNKGGKQQPYTINNVPSWLSLSKTTGSIDPNSKTTIKAVLDENVAIGEYLENLYLQTDFGYDQKLQVKLRVLAPEPNWNVDPTHFDYSMNIIGKIKVDGVLSVDSYDKIAAFYNEEVRGSVKLVYNDAYKEYFAFLTVYSNTNSGENLKFKIWDASQGKILEASIESNPSVTFMDNEVLGTLSKPYIFINSGLAEQEIKLNRGWTWISLNTNDENFTDLNALTKNLKLETSNRILSHSPALLDTYFKDNSNPANSRWSGTISANGGLSSSKMYKINVTEEQTLKIKGKSVDVATWSFPIKENWNWLAYPLASNQTTNEALAYFDAADGDVIKSQNLFAIYDPIIGWNGTLKYLEAGKGYMIKSSKEQTFKYPDNLEKSKTGKSASNSQQETIASEFKQYSQNMNAVVLLPKGFDELFVYDSKGVLKGASRNQMINGKELSFITIFGEDTEELSFTLGDGFSKKDTSKSFVFKGNNVLGTIADPVILEEVSKSENSIYPNPFTTTLNIELNADKKQEVNVQLYSVTGQLVFSQKTIIESGRNVISISPNIAQGVYIIETGVDGKKVRTKAIKN